MNEQECKSLEKLYDNIFDGEYVVFHGFDNGVIKNMQIESKTQKNEIIISNNLFEMKVIKNNEDLNYFSFEFENSRMLINQINKLNKEWKKKNL